MKRQLFILVLLFLAFSTVHAQDTIYKKTGETISSKIVEVNPSEVKYKKFDFQDGPVYTIEKADLFMIRYQNGLKDLFDTEKSKHNDDYAIQAKPSVKSSKLSLAELSNNPITVSNYRYSMGMINLNPKNVDLILLAKDDKQISLMIKNAQDNKRTSKLLSFAPIPCGVGAYVALIAGSIAASTTNYNSYTNTTTTSSNSIASNYLTLAGIFTAAGVGTAITAIVLNARSKQTRKEAVQLYNLKYYGTK
jgi:hypothetical protein